MREHYSDLITAVQRNCHIADAQFAGDYTLCVYLLKMREFYRWEQGISFHKVLTSDDVGDWLTGRENIWDELEEMAYVSLPVDGEMLDAFDNEAINQLLNPQGLVYSAGYGRRCRPLFFLGELEQKIEQGDYRILVAGREWARDMEAPPAMSQGKQVFIRRESLQRMLWEKVEEWRWNELDSPLGRAIACYDFDTDVVSALQSMTDAETKMVIAHEIGEVKAGELLGEEAWQAMLFTLPRSHAEIMLRALRDHLADTLQTIPQLLEEDNPASIHFFFGNLTAMRKKLAPDLVGAYQHWHETGSVERIAKWAENTQGQWSELGEKSLSLFGDKGRDSSESIERLLSETLTITE